jgi:hypothetical protein
MAHTLKYKGIQLELESGALDEIQCAIHRRLLDALSLTVLICTSRSRPNVYHLGVWHNASSQLEVRP